MAKMEKIKKEKDDNKEKSRGVVMLHYVNVVLEMLGR